MIMSVDGCYTPPPRGAVTGGAPASTRPSGPSAAEGAGSSQQGASTSTSGGKAAGADSWGWEEGAPSPIKSLKLLCVLVEPGVAQHVWKVGPCRQSLRTNKGSCTPASPARSTAHVRSCAVHWHVRAGAAPEPRGRGDAARDPRARAHRARQGARRQRRGLLRARAPGQAPGAAGRAGARARAGWVPAWVAGGKAKVQQLYAASILFGCVVSSCDRSWHLQFACRIASHRTRAWWAPWRP